MSGATTDVDVSLLPAWHRVGLGLGLGLGLGSGLGLGLG